MSINHRSRTDSTTSITDHCMWPLKAVFDSDEREAQWSTLHGGGTPPFTLQLIRDLHAGRTACSYSTCLCRPFSYDKAAYWRLLILPRHVLVDEPIYTGNFGIHVSDHLVSDYGLRRWCISTLNLWRGVKYWRTMNLWLTVWVCFATGRKPSNGTLAAGQQL